MKKRILRMVSICLVLTIVFSVAALATTDTYYPTVGEGGLKTYSVTRTSKGTISVNIQSNSAGSTFYITCPYSDGTIETKSMVTGTRQFLQRPAGTYSVGLRNDGAKTSLTVNLTYS